MTRLVSLQKRSVFRRFSTRKILKNFHGAFAKPAIGKRFLLKIKDLLSSIAVNFLGLARCLLMNFGPQDAVAAEMDFAARVNFS
jgi:hypothetical protein